MASYTLSNAAVEHARWLIESRQYLYRASEWRHKTIELAAHDLMQHLDKTSG
jgi:hypothetical protein